MKKSNYIVLLDPSIRDNKGTPALNIGDNIIYDAVRFVLRETFPTTELIRISSHEWFSSKQKDLMKKSLLNFMGGTNILTSDIRNFPRMTPEKKKGFYFFPGFDNLILLGTGWEKYQLRPDWATIIYYNRILNNNYYQSVRDSYSAQQLGKAFIRKILNTSCPTTWSLNTDFINSFNSNHNSILFTLTNYYPNDKIDNTLINHLFDSGQTEIVFFPQITEDLAYLNSLDTYKKNKSKIKILQTDYQEFIQFITTKKFNYIGSRLHGGLRCLLQDMPAMIIGVDNRALEMKKDTGLNIIERENFSALKKWIESEYIPAKIRLPIENIGLWKNQFQDIY